MDPTNQPAPITPTTPVPGVPETPQPGGTVMSQDQMRANLKELMSKIDSKFQDFNSQKFSTDNKVKEMQSKALRQIFDIFQSMGIDLSNVDEVRAFLEQLRSQNPALADQLTQALQSILGEDLASPPDEMGTQPGPTEPPIGPQVGPTGPPVGPQPGPTGPANMNIPNATVPPQGV
jgi:hypothetical protein